MVNAVLEDVGVATADPLDGASTCSSAATVSLCSVGMTTFARTPPVSYLLVKVLG